MKICISNARLAALPLALAAAFPVLAHAQTSVQSLADTVVTASRIATRADTLTSEVVVIEREEIDRSAGRTLLEVLERSASLQVSSNGGRGKLGSVFIRGTNPNHVLLLIDGVRYGSASAGTPIWENIPLDVIERIEVLKGPASTLYGADALGGVVQIFTRRGTKGFAPNGSVTLGSHGYRELAAGLQAQAGQEGQVRYALGVSHTTDRGFSATNPAVDSPFFLTYDPDRDGFRQDALNASLDWQLANDWKLSAGVVYADGLTHLDDGPGVDARTSLRSTVLRTGLEGKVLPAWTTRLNYSQSTDRSNALASASPYNLPGLFETTQEQVLWQNDFQTSAGTLLVGAETLLQKLSSSTAYDATRRRTNAVMLGLTGSAGAHSWQFNLRHDDNSQFGGSSTGYAGYGYQINSQWRAHAGYGTSFAAPSFNYLYYPGYSNPLLKPEEGKNAELGLDWTQGVHHAKLIRFDNRISNLISSPAPTYLPVNVDKARIKGWTLGYDASLDALTVRASVDALDPRNALTGKVLQRRAKSQVTLGADYALGPWSLGGSLLSIGSRFDDVANTLRLSGYTTADVRLGYALNKSWSLQAKLNNLSNRQYETARGYNQPGREMFVTLRYQP